MRLIASVPPFIPVSRVPILQTMAHGPGNGALLNSLRDVKTSGWIAAHPSGNAAVDNLHADSSGGAPRLQRPFGDAHPLFADVMAEGDAANDAHPTAEARNGTPTDGNQN